MIDDRFEEGTVMKGKDLKGYSLCKILSEDMKMRGFQYKIGMNEDVNPLALAGCCNPGLYFCLVRDACKCLEYGTKLAVVSIPDEEDVYVDTGKFFRTHKIEIKKVMPLCDVEAWEYLIRNGADITADDNHAVRLAARGGYLEVVKYLHKNGADITADNNFAILSAIKNGFLDVVRYLHESGVDMITNYNDAIHYAEANGYTDIVKYLKVNM